MPNQKLIPYFSEKRGTPMIRMRLVFDIPQVQVSGLCLNKRTVPGAKLNGLTYTSEIPDVVDENHVYNTIVYRKPFIVLTNNTHYSFYCAKNKEGFTVRELCDCMRDHEFNTRNMNETVNTHHRFFEGFYSNPDGSFEILWGS